jgi:hypothetical protein
VSWYLTIRGASDYSQFAPTAQLVEFLAAMPEFRQTGPVQFEAADGQSLVCVILANCDQRGNYCTDEVFLQRVNVVELVCSYSGEPTWYDALAGRIAAFLGWSAFEDKEERQVWPRVERKERQADQR